MAIFRYRIPNWQGGDETPPPEYEVHSTDDIVNCKHMKYFSENNEGFQKLSKRPTQFRGAVCEIIAEFEIKEHWVVIGFLIADADYEEIDLPEFKLKK